MMSQWRLMLAQVNHFHQQEVNWNVIYVTKVLTILTVWSHLWSLQHSSIFLTFFYILSAKYGKGLHFCIAGDTNELKLNSILSLSSNLVQVVTQPTRIDPKTAYEAILDPVNMTLSQYYQEPLCLDPLDPDPDKNGKKSDHWIVLLKPINVINNKSARVTRQFLSLE